MPNLGATALTIRCEALRFVGTLTESAEVGRRAVTIAREERNAVHLAHAAYQLANTYLWGEYLDEATEAHQELHEWAGLAASRWIAWSDWIASCLDIRAGRTTLADVALRRARERFTAEGLQDGLVSVDTVRLTWRRVEGNTTNFSAATLELRDLINRGRRGQFYARGHKFSLEAVDFELAEFERCHGGRAQAARARYEQLTRSDYALHQGLAYLGLARLDAGTSEGQLSQERAQAIGRRIGCRLLVEDALGGLSSEEVAAQDIVFC